MDRKSVSPIISNMRATLWDMIFQALKEKKGQDNGPVSVKFSYPIFVTYSLDIIESGVSPWYDEVDGIEYQPETGDIRVHGMHQDRHWYVKDDGTLGLESLAAIAEETDKIIK